MSSLAFYCLDNQNGSFVADVILGDGSITEDCTSTRYYPDASNVWQEFGSGVVGQYYYNGEWYMPYHGPWTNDITYSYDLTQSEWTASNVTVALNQTGMRGNANGASLLTATAGNGTVIYEAVTAASAVHGTRWFLKRSVGTGDIEITMDNGSTYTDITAALDAASGWYEFVTDQTLANPQIGIRMVTSGDAVIVGNAELAINPAITSTPVAILTWNSPIFTNGATGSVLEIVPHVPITNHDGDLALYYAECAVATADPEHGLTDTYIFSLDNGDEDGAVSNMANGNFWSSQFLNPTLGAGASTTQVTYPVAAGDKFRICAWHDSGADNAQYSLNGDLSGVATTYGAYETGSVMHLIQRQAGTATSTSVLIRNLRRYDIDDFADGTALELAIACPVSSWGGQNLVRQSHLIGNEVHNGNPWTNTGTSAAANNATGLDADHSAATCTESDAGSARRFDQSNIVLAADTEPVTLRIFIDKDADEARFPRIDCNLTGGTARSGWFYLNTSTGAIVDSAGNTFTTQVSRDAGDWWEVLMTLPANVNNTNAQMWVYPAYTDTMGTAAVAALTGSIIVGNVELYQGLTAAEVPAGTANAVFTPPQFLDPVELTAAAAIDGNAWKTYVPVSTVTGRTSRWIVSSDGFIPIVDET